MRLLVLLALVLPLLGMGLIPKASCRVSMADPGTVTKWETVPARKSGTGNWQADSVGTLTCKTIGIPDADWQRADYIKFTTTHGTVFLCKQGKPCPWAIVP